LGKRVLDFFPDLIAAALFRIKKNFQNEFFSKNKRESGKKFESK